MTLWIKSTATILLFLTVATLPQAAQSYERKALLDNRLNPNVEYRTIETDHFFIHFPEHLAASALKIRDVSQSVYKKVSGFFGWELTEKTHIVVGDRSDHTSLFALTFPHRQIYFDASLPAISRGLNEYRDWYEWLLTHEFGHVYQMSRATGLYTVFGKFLGTTVQPNMVVPGWFKEGLSIVLETNLTGRGRGNGPFYRMFMRQAVANNDLKNSDFASLDTINSHVSPTWPWTLRAYLFGYYLVEKLNSKDEGAIRLVEQIGSSFPSTFEHQLAESAQRPLNEFWTSLSVDLHSRFEREIEDIQKENVTEPTYLTRSGFFKNGLTISKNGTSLLTTQVRPEKESRIIQLNLNSDSPDQFLREDVLVSRSTGAQISFSNSSRFIAYDESSKVGRYNIISDLVIYDLKEKTQSAISPRIRARDPDIHPDGKRIVFVLNEKGKNKLVVTDTAFQNPVVLIHDVGFSRISSPRFNATGTKVVMSIHNDKTGGEDVVLYEDSKLKPLISNGSLNFAPTWVPGKNQILFSSDLYKGVFNLFMYDLDTRALTRLTNVIGGLFSPAASPDGRIIYCISYHSGGYDVAKIPFVNTPRFPVLSESVLVSREFSYMIQANSSQSDSVRDRSSNPYRSFNYLAPQYVAPSFAFFPGTTQFGFSLGAVDPLYLRHYELNLMHDTSTEGPVGRLYYYDGKNETAWDFELSKSSFRDPTTGFDFERLNSQLSVLIPVRGLIRNSYLRPNLRTSNVKFLSETTNYGAGLSLVGDTEFTQIGFSFPESGHFLELNGTQFFGATDQDQDFSKFNLKYRSHLQLVDRTVYHLGLDGAYFAAQNLDANNGLLVGGLWSFPFSWNSEVSIYGYPVNQFLARDTQVLTQRVTFSFSQFETFLKPWVPLYLERLSGAVVAQLARLNTRESVKTPTSIGIELHQNFVLGHLFSLKGALGVYRGDSAFGGETQLILSFEQSH